MPPARPSRRSEAGFRRSGDRVARPLGGGQNNSATGTAAAVGGGSQNNAQGAFSTVPGGNGNEAGATRELRGRTNTVVDPLHNGTFLYSDTSPTEFDSVIANEFAARASGGFASRTNAGATTGTAICPPARHLQHQRPQHKSRASSRSTVRTFFRSSNRSR